MTNVTIAYGAPVPDHMVASVAQTVGLFAKYGINAKVEFLQSTELLSALRTGQVQFVSIPAPEQQELAINGTDIVEIAQWEDEFDNILVAGPKYPTLASLSGGTISVSKPGDFASLLVTIAESQNNIKLRQIPLAGLSSQIAAFESGQVDAVPALSPNQLASVQAKLPGTHVLVDWRTVPNVPAIEFVGYGPWLTAHRATVVNVLKGINAGFNYYKDPANESTVVGIISKVTGTPTAVATAGYQDAIKAMSPTIVPSLLAQQNALKYIVGLYPAAKTYDASKLLDTSYVTAALK